MVSRVAHGARMGPRSLAVGTAVAVVAALAAPALAAGALPRTAAPLPGSSFQGADGNQASEGGLVDWDALQDAGRVRHAAFRSGAMAGGV